MIDPRISALIRGTIFVRDLDRATAFYRALGLTETYFEGVLEDASASGIIGYAEPLPLSVRIVKRPGPNYGMIGLFKMDDGLNPEVVPMASGPARVGEVALVFYVASMADAMAAARAAGAVYAPEPGIFVMEHRQQAEVCIRDCDGVLLNLVETDPVQQERTRPELDYS